MRFFRAIVLACAAGVLDRISADGAYLIFCSYDYSEPGVDDARTIYAVYGSDGQEILPMGASLDEVRAAVP